MYDWLIVACVVIVFCALSWKIAWALAHLARRRDIDEIREELRAEISEERQELEADMAALTREMEAAILEMRDEIKKDMETALDDWD